MAREFFRHPKLAAECTGVDEHLIERLHTILQILTCSSKPKNMEKFRTYAITTYELCIDLYEWYPMPPSVHKILIHGADIMETFELPLGFYSEEALECNNKYFRKARSNHSRMFDRTKSNEDTFKHLLLCSDPYLATLREDRTTKLLVKTDAAKNLLK